MQRHARDRPIYRCMGILVCRVNQLSHHRNVHHNKQTLHLQEGDRVMTDGVCDTAWEISFSLWLASINPVIVFVTIGRLHYLYPVHENLLVVCTFVLYHIILYHQSPSPPSNRCIVK